MSLPSHSDRVVVIGAGPAGSACAIMLRQAGLEVVLCDSGNFSSLQTETLHPGIEPLWEMLGIAGSFRALEFPRHQGYFVSSSADSSFQSYGNGWLGYQIDRPRLRELLWQRAGELGVHFLMPVRANDIILDNDAVHGVQTSRGDFAAGFVVDATGSTRFLSRRLGLDVMQYSRKMVVQYGYGRPQQSEWTQSPHFKAGNGAWTWTAPIDSERLHWMRLLRKGDVVNRTWTPQNVDCSQSMKLHAADVTWRAVAQPARKRFFVVGDAAGTIDPASGNGVIRAIMSAIMAAHLVGHVLTRRISLSASAAFYSVWFHQLYVAQCRELAERYRQMGIQVDYAGPDFGQRGRGSVLDRSAFRYQI